MILQSNGRQVVKQGKTEIQKIEYLENEKSSLDQGSTYLFEESS